MLCKTRYNINICRCDGIGRRDGLKIRWWRHRVGSSPTTGTSQDNTIRALLGCVIFFYFDINQIHQ